MPCWEVNLMTVEFKARHWPLLEKALQSLKMGFCYDEVRGVVQVGRSIRIDLNKQQVTADAREFYRVNELKRAYSLAAVNAAAKKNRWAVRKQAQNKLQLRRF